MPIALAQDFAGFGFASGRQRRYILRIHNVASSLSTSIDNQAMNRIGGLQLFRSGKLTAADSVIASVIESTLFDISNAELIAAPESASVSRRPESLPLFASAM